MWYLGDRLPAAIACSTSIWMTGPFSQWTLTMPPPSAARRMVLEMVPSSTMRTPGYAVNNLKLVTPSRSIRVLTSARVLSLTSTMIMWAPTSTQALAARLCQSSRPTSGLSPRVWLQKSTTQVVPPKAAALVPVPKVSTVRATPKSQSRCVCTSIPPGITSRPLASCTSTSPPASMPLPMVCTRPSSIRTSAS